VAAADRKASKAPAGDTPDYFEKLLEKPCTNHPYRVGHLLKNCSLMKKWLSGNSKKGDQKKKPEAEADGEKDKQDAFLDTDRCLKIFGGPTACESRHRKRVTCREVFIAEPAMPAYL